MSDCILTQVDAIPASMLLQLHLCLQAAVMHDDQEIAECLSPSAQQEAGLDPLEAAIDLSESEHSDQGVSLAACLCIIASLCCIAANIAPLVPQSNITSTSKSHSVQGH